MFILLWLYLFFTFQVCPFFWSIVDKSALDEPYYLYTSFLICLVLNFFISYWRENFNNNKDILYKFISFLFKPLGFIITFFVCELNKILNFVKTMKYKKFLDLFKVFLNFIYSLPGLIWRPIFKKSSYFGYFRINKSKWNKN